MKLLITGGAGFVGSSLVRYWQAQYPKDQVVVLDALTYAGRRGNLPADSANFTFIKGNICDVPLVAQVFEKYQIQAVINLAAESHVDRSIADPLLFVHTNVDGVANLLQAANLHGNVRFLQVSTDEVYGSRQTGRFKETDALNPSSPYAASKASGDLLALAFHTTYQLNVSVTRCTNNFGPYQFPEKLIPLMIQHLQDDQPLPLYGSGQNVRDWLYVEDHCQALDLVLHQGQAGRIYNISAHQEWANRPLVARLRKLMAKPAVPIVQAAERPGHDFRYALDSRRIEEELGWQAETPFAAGLAKTVAWYRANEAWWRPLLAERLPFDQ